MVRRRWFFCAETAEQRSAWMNPSSKSVAFVPRTTEAITELPMPCNIVQQKIMNGCPGNELRRCGHMVGNFPFFWPARVLANKSECAVLLLLCFSTCCRSKSIQCSIHLMTPIQESDLSKESLGRLAFTATSTNSRCALQQSLAVLMFCSFRSVLFEYLPWSNLDTWSYLSTQWHGIVLYVEHSCNRKD